MKAIDIPPIDFHWQSGPDGDGTATIEWIVMPDRNTGVGSGLVRFLNYEPNPDDLPYRGVVNIAIENWKFEFKGMCFYRKGDSPLREEHEDIKDHLTDPEGWDMEGFSRRQKADGRVVVKVYRHKKRKEL